MEGLEQRAVLVSYASSTWPGKAPNKAAAKDIQAARGNTEGTTDTSVWLIDKAEVKKNESAFNAVYLFWRNNTLPWEDKRGGARLLPGANFARFKAGIDALITAALERADEFEVDYPRLKAAWEPMLNGLAATIDAKYYPDPVMIRRQFNIGVEYSPLPLSPQSLTLKFLGADEFDQLRERIGATWNAQENAAIGDLYKRLAQAVKHAAETLADPKAIFRDSLVGNIAELAELIPALNFRNDPDLDALAELAAGKLAAIDPETLRTDLKVRGRIAGEAGELLTQITGAGSRFIDMS